LLRLSSKRVNAHALAPYAPRGDQFLAYAVLAFHHAAAHRHLVGGLGQRLAGQVDVHAADLEHHDAGLHHGAPELRLAFAAALAGFKRLGRNRLVREHADPVLARLANRTAARDSRGPDLAAGDP